MLRYFYAWTPLVAVGGTVILLCPYLALIALAGISLTVLAALAGAIVAAPYMLGRAVARRWRSRSDASQQEAAALGAYGHAYVYAERKGAMS
jgi:membrane protein implicated in regulation of membrane protease activity